MDERFDFGEALKRLREGHAVTRSGWYDTKAKPTVRLQVPDEHSKMTEPYLYMEKFSEHGVVVFPLDLSCESILATDWIVTHEFSGGVA